MAHPSDALPKNTFILNGTNDLALTDGKHVYAIYNPTASAVSVDITGSIYTWQTDAYKPIATEQTAIAIPTGGTLYGNFTNVGCATAKVICYVS